MISRDDLFMFFILVFWALKVGGRGGGGGGVKRQKTAQNEKYKLHPILCYISGAV